MPLLIHPAPTIYNISSWECHQKSAHMKLLPVGSGTWAHCLAVCSIKCCKESQHEVPIRTASCRIWSYYAPPERRRLFTSQLGVTFTLVIGYYDAIKQFSQFQTFEVRETITTLCYNVPQLWTGLPVYSTIIWHSDTMFTRFSTSSLIGIIFISNPSIHFICRIDTMQLCYVILYALCSTVSSASAAA